MLRFSTNQFAEVLRSYLQSWIGRLRPTLLLALFLCIPAPAAVAEETPRAATHQQRGENLRDAPQFHSEIRIPYAAFTEEEVERLHVRLETLNGGEPIQLNHLYAVAEVSFGLGEGWQVHDASLDLNISASELLADAVSLTVQLNGRAVDTIPISEIRAGVVSVELPAASLQSGQNRLTFTARLDLADEACAVWTHPARWLAIEPGSMMHLSFAAEEAVLDLSDFPRPFVSPELSLVNEGKPVTTLFVHPDNPGDETLSAVAGLAYLLGREGMAPGSWRPQLIEAADFTPAMALDRDVVLVGNRETNPWLAGIVGDEQEEKDTIAMTVSPWDSDQAVLVLADNHPEDGITPADALADPARRLLMQGEVAYIEPAWPEAPSLPPPQTTFRELGYTDRTVRGLGVRSLIYSLYLPFAQRPSRTTLRLQLAHSSAIDLTNSAATVHLNGFAVATILLNARSARLEPIEISLPVSRLRPGENFIRFTFDMRPRNPTCQDLSETVWATIFNTSELEAPRRSSFPVPDLTHYPQPLADISGSSFVLPDNADAPLLEKVMLIAATFGAEAHRQATPPRLHRAGNFVPERMMTPHTVLIGEPAVNPFVSELNQQLPLAFTLDGSRLEEDRGVYLPEWTETAPFGLIQYLRSPWNREGTLLVVSGNDPQGTEWAVDLLISPLGDKWTDGNVVLVGSDERDIARRLVAQEVAAAANLSRFGGSWWLRLFAQPQPLLVLFTALLAVSAVLGPAFFWHYFQDRLRDTGARLRQRMWSPIKREDDGRNED